MCSPTVLHLFTDNFDYCSVEHFVKGILDNQEVGIMKVVMGSCVCSVLEWGMGIAQWLECQTCDWKVMGLNRWRSSRRIFSSRVNFLYWLLFLYLSHPRVTALSEWCCVTHFMGAGHVSRQKERNRGSLIWTFLNKDTHALFNHLYVSVFQWQCSARLKLFLFVGQILGNTIHVNVLKDKYCVRVTNPYMYDVVR